MTRTPIACLLVLASFTSGLMSAEPAPPNIVYILADDLGYGDLGCYNAASKIPTPNLDQLAKEGRRFTDAHSPSAVCTPTRYALLTGRYAWRTRLQRNVIGPFAPPLIDAKQLTVAEMLRKQGYATACIGKWHLGWGWPKPGATGQRDFTKPITDGPTTRGFDHYFGTDVPNYPPYCFIENDRTVGIPSAMAPVGRNFFNIPGPMLPDWKLVDVLPALEKRAVEYIGEAAKAKQPFFLYLPLTSPHYPVVPAANFKGKSKVGDYGDFVMQTDHLVGEVLKSLKSAGITDRTLVIFTSDNGPEVVEVKPGAYDRLKDTGHASMGTLRGTKRDAWEGGHRVPFLARWPGRIVAGTTCNETICHVDLLATLAALLGVKLPADMAVDSVNILPALLGREHKTPLREATVHHSGQGHFAIRRGEWVLLLAPTGDNNAKNGEPNWFRNDRGYQTHNQAGELYNLTIDPTQKTNRYATEPAKVKELAAIMERYVVEGRSTPGPKQANDVDVLWDKRIKSTPKAFLPVVDTHVHLWDIERRDGLGWIAPDNKTLHRSFLPKQHRPLADANGVRSVVVVQAGQSLPDNQWNLDITRDDKQLYAGVVGNLSKVIGTDEFLPLFEKLCKDERYVGYRLSGRYQKKLSEEFFRHLERTAEAGRTVDILVNEYTLDDVAEIGRRVPKLKIILDHVGNVELTDQPLNADWVKRFKTVAEHRNVYCKVSALYGRVKKQPAPKTLDFYKPLLDLATTAFGEDRLIFGSDWPVSETTGDYASVIALVWQYFDSKGPDITKKVFCTNAVRFYGIPEPKARE